MKNTDPDAPATFPEGYVPGKFRTDEEVEASIKTHEGLTGMTERDAEALEKRYPHLQSMRKDERCRMVWYETQILQEMGLI